MSSLNIEQLRQALLQLRDEGYLECRDNNHHCELTASGRLLMFGTRKEVMEVTQATGPLVVQEVQLAILQKDWTLGFINFITDAKVPQWLDNGKGEPYRANAYSEPAMKIFRKAIEKEGVRYDILVKSTMLYYKSQKNRFKKSLGNYFVQGDWRSDYRNLLEAAGTGNIEQHIKSELDGSATNYQLG